MNNFKIIIVGDSVNCPISSLEQEYIKDEISKIFESLNIQNFNIYMEV